MRVGPHTHKDPVHKTPLLKVVFYVRASRRVFVCVRVGRIELPTRAWQARVIPLNHTRK